MAPYGVDPYFRFRKKRRAWRAAVPASWVSLISLCLVVGLAGASMLTHPIAVQIVNAEENGIRSDLAYHYGHSNAGPTDVNGIAVFWPREGVAMLSVHVMPHLLDGDRYVWWLTNSSTGAAMRLGIFNTAETGEGYMDIFLKHALPPGANTVVITIAHPGDSLTTPGPLRTLWGRFPPQTIPPTPTNSKTGSGAVPTPTNNDNPSRLAWGCFAGSARAQIRWPEQGHSASNVNICAASSLPDWLHRLPVPMVVLPQTGGRMEDPILDFLQQKHFSE